MRKERINTKKEKEKKEKNDNIRKKKKKKDVHIKKEMINSEKTK